MAVFIQFSLFIPLSLEVIIVALGYIYSAKMYGEMKKKNNDLYRPNVQGHRFGLIREPELCSHFQILHQAVFILSVSLHILQCGAHFISHTHLKSNLLDRQSNLVTDLSTSCFNNDFGPKLNTLNFTSSLLYCPFFLSYLFFFLVHFGLCMHFKNTWGIPM